MFRCLEWRRHDICQELALTSHYILLFSSPLPHFGIDVMSFLSYFIWFFFLVFMIDILFVNFIPLGMTGNLRKLWCLFFSSVQWFQSGWARSSCYLVMDVMVFGIDIRKRLLAQAE
jgi:uncharacterized RDD family membrane protein YckC